MIFTLREVLIMQLLKITTIPLEYDLNIQNAKLTAPQIEPAKLSQ